MQEAQHTFSEIKEYANEYFASKMPMANKKKEEPPPPSGISPGQVVDFSTMVIGYGLVSKWLYNKLTK